MSECANGHEITGTTYWGADKECPECKIIRLETELADKETQFGMGLANWDMRCRKLEMEINDMSAEKDMLKGQVLDLNQVINKLKVENKRLLAELHESDSPIGQAYQSVVKELEDQIASLKEGLKKGINIVLYDRDGEDSDFVEIENDQYKTIDIGKRKKKGKYTYLMITTEDILALTSEKKCEHKNTHFEDWPDGGAIEVCEDCGMSHHHWEQGESSWIMVKDIEQARKEVQKGIDEICYPAKGKCFNEGE